MLIFLGSSKHCTIRYYSTTINTSTYTTSNDTNHDSVMTVTIVEEVIANHPEIIEAGKLTLRSDNCSCQYKCLFVFKALLDIAKKYNINIEFFYGEAGHGRGLIDAMVWFGCKGPMRKHIIQTDKWFENAEKMIEFLLEHFEDDLTKEYYFVDEKGHCSMEEERSGRT